MEKPPPAGARSPARLERIPVTDIIKCENVRDGIRPGGDRPTRGIDPRPWPDRAAPGRQDPEHPGKYRLIAGERRLRGMIHAGIDRGRVHC